MRLTLLLILGVLLAGGGVAQPADTLPNRGGALVAASRTFVIYSDPVANLHDFLVWNARSPEPAEPAPDCLAGLSAEQRAGFEHAREHYTVFATPAADRLLLALRYRLAGFGDGGLAETAAIDATLAELPLAAPAYEACWWPTHDARNRRWIAAVEPLLAAHEEAIGERLSELYGEQFQRPFPVDVVSYSGFSGADSVINPHHILVSSIRASNTGYSGLEILFHEASHTVFGPRTGGRLWTEIEAAAAADGAPLPPDFWHAMLFYTTGSAVQSHLAEHRIDYEQYVYTEGLFEQAWPAYRGPLERLWQPYVNGRVPLTDALQLLVAAPKLPDRGDALGGASRSFVFYSDPITNLHDFLVWNARSSEAVEPKPECLANLPAEQREAFEHARDYYAKTFANGGGELILLSLRWRLANFGDINLADAAQIAATVAELAPAAPAYEACWWRQHDERNRRWIANLQPLLEANEDTLRVRFAELYGRQLARWLPVDVVGYAGVDAGSPVLNPHHLLISSAKLSSPGHSLEVLFREASQTLFGVRAPGALWQALQQVSSSSNKPLPQTFSRLLPFFTAGQVVQARLVDQGRQDYTPYVYSEGLMERSLPSHQEVLEQVWQPYVDSRVPMADAVQQLVDALPAEAR